MLQIISVFLRFPIYHGFSSSVIDGRVPCVACETNKRVNRIMIPAKISCPSSDWTLEYQGFIMSMAEHRGQGDTDLYNVEFHATSYVCVDSNPETLSSYASGGNRGSLIYMVGADCIGIGALQNCPPYKQGPVLSCVPWSAQNKCIRLSCPINNNIQFLNYYQFVRVSA